MSRRGPKIDPVETLRAEIAALPAKRGSRGTVVTTDFLSGAYGRVIAAAKARRMSVPAYIRRATYAMAAHDLGIDVLDLLRDDPRCSRENGVAIPDPEGVKYGPWSISSLNREESGRVDAAGDAVGG